MKISRRSDPNLSSVHKWDIMTHFSSAIQANCSKLSHTTATTVRVCVCASYKAAYNTGSVFFIDGGNDFLRRAFDTTLLNETLVQTP